MSTSIPSAAFAAAPSTDLHPPLSPSQYLARKLAVVREKLAKTILLPIATADPEHDEAHDDQRDAHPCAFARASQRSAASRYHDNS